MIANRVAVCTADEAGERKLAGGAEAGGVGVMEVAGVGHELSPIAVRVTGTRYAAFLVPFRGKERPKWGKVVDPTAALHNPDVRSILFQVVQEF